MDIFSDGFRGRKSSGSRASADKTMQETHDVDELSRLVEALRRKVNAQAERINELEGQVSRMDRVVDPDPGRTSYDELTKPQKVHRLRKALAENASGTNGQDAMKYKAVMALFGGHPSPGHCYDLMERAGEADGYEYDESRGGEKRIRVELDAVNDDALVHAANKATEGVAV